MDYKDRIRDEIAELDKRRGDLGRFFDSKEYEELKYSQRYLLLKQASIMSEYFDILNARLD